MEFNALSLTIIGISVFVVIIKVVYHNNKKTIGNNKIKGDGNTQQNGESNSIMHINEVNINSNAFETSPKAESKELSSDDIKAKVKVLFVDDQEFPVVEYLRSIGYLGVDYMEDIVDIDDNKVKYAHIIFLDINGVGLKMGFKNQGMGLCGAIKKKYGDSKRVILYSGETSGDIFDEDAKKADETLAKNSDYMQFISYITQYAKELL